MHIEGKKIKDILAENLEIPENQRKYDWNSVHADDLWNDILEYSDKDEENFYLGTILLLETDRKHEKKTHIPNY